MSQSGRPALDSMRFVGIGFSFLVEVGVFGAIGYWLDQRLETDPWLLLVGVVCGMTYAIWHLVRVANRFEEMRRERLREEEAARKDESGDERA